MHNIVNVPRVLHYSTSFSDGILSTYMMYSRLSLIWMGP